MSKFYLPSDYIFLGRLFVFIAALIFVILFSGCSDNLEELNSQNNEPKESLTALSYSISKEEAIDISEKVLKKTPTRGLIDFPTFEYVVNNTQTRGTLMPDTIAYILNYPNDAGFVIIATDRRVYPVLGFSDVGKFSFDNENVKANFIDRLDTYIEENISDSLYYVSENDFDGCYEVNPAVQISLSQGAPWNKYVVMEHPNCPAGCVAVATALVMTHSFSELSYHNSTFHMQSIIKAIKDGQQESNNNAPKRIIGTNPPVQPTYTYEQAVDSIAKLLYWIGKDVDMTYEPNGSGAFSYNAYSLCKSLNMLIPSGYVAFDINDITQYLKDNCIVYLRGDGINVKGGHAWVSDGCYFCVDPEDRSRITQTYIHCDWGWGGLSNGYYSGSVFEAYYSYMPTIYFAVKRFW